MQYMQCMTVETCQSLNVTLGTCNEFDLDMRACCYLTDTDPYGSLTTTTSSSTTTTTTTKFTTTSTSSTSLNGCPAGWQKSLVLPKCYRILPESQVVKTVDQETVCIQSEWFSSLSACSSYQGAALVSIANNFENTQLGDLYRSQADFLWLGLNAATGEWSWIDGKVFFVQLTSDLQNVTYTHWAPGHPVADKSCAKLSMSSGLWYAEDCEAEFIPACEIFL